MKKKKITQVFERAFRKVKVFNNRNYIVIIILLNILGYSRSKSECYLMIYTEQVLEIFRKYYYLFK